MDVELIAAPADGVLDLTQPAVVYDKKEEAAEVVTEEAAVGQPADEAQAEPEVPATEDEPEYYFGDARVQVEVPEEVGNALAEAGIEPQQLLSELFAKEGKFELSDATREKLDAKFGKTLVDGYLKMYRSMNEQTLKDAASAVAAEKQTEADRHSEYNEVVGGAAGIEALESFVLSSYDDKQIASYNAVMSGDSFDAQMLVLRAVRSEMQAKEKLSKGDTSVALIGDDTPASPNTSGPAVKTTLSAAEYARIMEDEKYWTDKAYQKQVDTSRLAGKRAGL